MHLSLIFGSRYQHNHVPKALSISKTLVIFLTIFQLVVPHIVDIDINEMSSFEFIDRFVFLTVEESIYKDQQKTNDLFVDTIGDDYGVMIYNIYYDTDITPGLHMMIYRDDIDWSNIRKDSQFSCSSFFDSAAVVINLDRHSGDSGETFINYHFPGQRANHGHANGVLFLKKFDSDLSYGFIALLSCNQHEEVCFESCQGPITGVRGSVKFSNGKGKGHKYLSGDEFGILEASCVFFSLQTLLALLLVNISSRLERLNRFHFTVKLLVWSVLLQWLSLLLSLIYWAVLQTHGKKLLEVLLASYFMMQLSAYAFIIMLIMVAKGWTIVRKHISANGKTKLVAASVFYLLVVTYSALYEVYSYDPGVVTFRYNASPGVLTIFVRLGAYCWFCYAIYVTRINYPNSKRRFYRKFSVVGSLWFLYMPLFSLISLIIYHESNEFVLQLFVYTWENIFILVGQLLLSMMYMPDSTWNKSFPFHHEIDEEAEADGNVAFKFKGETNNETQLALSPTDSAENVFDRIRGAGSGLSAALKSVNTLNKKLSDILADWDCEEDGDVSYRSRDHDTLRRRR